MLPPLQYISKNTPSKFIVLLMYVDNKLSKYINYTMNLESEFLLIYYNGGNT
jgi:hypothetical protein